MLFKINNSTKLKIGLTYKIFRYTPLMPHFAPEDPLVAISKIIKLYPPDTIKILRIEMKNNTPWYHVDSKRIDAETNSKGWINSISLIKKHA